jgi:signal transduction histidine kinase
MAAQGYLMILIDHDRLTITQGLWLLFAIAAPLAWLAFLWTSRQLVEGRRRHEATLAHNRELLQLAETSRTLNHEIRNPLAAILLQTALLKRRCEGPAPQEIRIIEAEVRRIEGLMDRVRDFLRDPRGRQVPVSVWPFLGDLALRFPPDLRLDPPEDPGVWASLDPERFRSIVENLVRNARECGPDPQVEIRLEPGRQKFMVTVLDRGPGLGGLSAEEVMAPFFTTKPQGSGLGLALARSFVEAQGGTLSLLPREGGGLAARLEFPRIPAPDS